MTETFDPELAGPQKANGGPTYPDGLEIRAAQVVEVFAPKRMLELIVMPYETEADVVYEGRMIREICTRGAFGSVQERTRRIIVNRDHDLNRICGKVVALHPSREEGLVAEVKILKQAAEGDATLEAVEEGMLDASAGFALLRQDNGRGPVYPDAETWEQHGTLRRLNRLHLHHVALTPDPAYVDARVLAVRNAATIATGTTPNRDRLRYDHYAALAADIDRRYGLGR
jgi:HK97 family phage prohead protease